MKSLFEHRSIRSYTNTAIPKDVLDTILLAAQRASNTGNMQWYSIIVTTDAKKRKQLCEQAHFNQAMVAQAPVVLTFCADLNRFTKWCNSNNAEPQYDNFLSFYTASVDAVIAAQNACIASESLGLGVCYLGTTNYTAPKIIEILNLPSMVVPVTTVVLGYAEEVPELTPRLPEQAVVHYESYTDFDSDAIARIYSEREQQADSKKFVEENGVENLAQVFTKKRYTAQNNITFSQTLLSIIESQGFMNNK